jgi:stage V sporulation protein AC
MKQKVVQDVLNRDKVKRPILLNAFRAFLIGGTIALIGQFLLYMYQYQIKLDKSVAISLMSVTLVLISVLLTGFGIYDKIGQFAGAGTIVPITGFANSMASAAIESKSEGLVLGIMTNVFKLAGAVITAGVVSAVIFGAIKYFFKIGV